MLENEHQRFIQDGWKITEESDPGVVVIVNTVGGILLVEHERIDNVSLETPRGYLEKDEMAIIGAIRELKEELNINKEEIHSLDLLGIATPDNSYIKQKVYYISAQLDGSTKHADKDLSTEEGLIHLHWYDWEEIPELIISGKINDNYTLSAMAFIMSAQKERHRHDLSHKKKY